MDNEKKQVKNIFSVANAKDFRIQTKITKNNLTVETNELNFDQNAYNSTIMSVKLNSSLSPYPPMKFRKTLNLLSTPKLSALTKNNSDVKFERLYMSMDKQTLKHEEDENDKEITKKLNDSFELEIEDQKPKELVGMPAINCYYSYYKKLDKIKDKNKISFTKGLINFFIF